MAVRPQIYADQSETRVLPLPDLSGPAPGAIIGEAAAELGRAGVDYLKQRDQLQLSQARSDRAVAFAEMQARVSARVADLRSTAGPGAAGHEEATGRLIEEETAAFLGTIGDVRLQREFAPDIARWRAGTVLGEQQYAIRERATKQVDDHETARDLRANGLRTKADANDLQIALDQSERMVAGYTLPDGAKATLLREDRDRLSRSYLEGLGAPDRLRLLEAGTFDGLIEPKTKDLLVGEAQVEIRSAQAAARQQATLAKAEVRDRIEGVARLTRDGIPLPDADIAQAREQARAHGLDALDYELGVALERNRTTRETSAWLPPDFDARIVDLNAKIAAGGDSPDPALVVQRDHLLTLRTRRTGQLRDHPVEFLASIGRPLAAIDVNDPATMGAAQIAERGRAMRALAERTGMPLRLLTEAEAAPLAEAIATGNSADRLQAAMTIGRFGGDAEAVLRQVAPNDDTFRIAARLGTLPERRVAAAAMRDALTGPDAIKANPKILDRTSAQAVFTAATADALAWLPPSYRAGLLETAANIYATRATRAGIEKWDAESFRAAIGDAIGGYWKGGTYLGGIAQRRSGDILLPVGMAAAEFDTRLQRATAQQLVAASNGAPVWQGGRPVRGAELKQMLPVAVGDGLYAFRTGNGFLTLADGRTPYRLNIRRVPADAR